MKFLAILKDSLRETLDVKLFYVLLGLSLLVILFVGSITYKPLSMEPQLKRALHPVMFNPEKSFTFKLVMLLIQNSDTADIIAVPEIKDFKRTDDRDTDKPWAGDYQFKLNLPLLILREKESIWAP